VKRNKNSRRKSETLRPKKKIERGKAKISSCPAKRDCSGWGSGGLLVWGRNCGGERDLGALTIGAQSCLVRRGRLGEVGVFPGTTVGSWLGTAHQKAKDLRGKESKPESAVAVKEGGMKRKKSNRQESRERGLIKCGPGWRLEYL